MHVVVVVELGEVNGLSVDCASGHVYWTDAQKRRIEMSDYAGKNRRVVIHTDLLAPRALIIDPTHGYKNLLLYAYTELSAAVSFTTVTPMIIHLRYSCSNLLLFQPTNS